MKPTIYLIHGYIASGKTTYAKNLETKTSAVRFTLDEWMVHFYGVNPPSDHFEVYEDKVKTMIWLMSEKFLSKNVSIILDYGFWKFSERNRYRNHAERLGVAYELHTITLNDQTALSRLKSRTDVMPEGELFIDENAYQILKEKYEPLTQDEIETAKIIMN